MNFPFFIARRYLFSRKRFSAVNVVSLVSAVAICVVSSALVCILSIFNGYESLIMKHSAVTDPPLLIRTADHSMLHADDATLLSALQTAGISSYSFTLKGEGLVRTSLRQQAVALLGVDDRYVGTVNIDSIAFAGTFSIEGLSGMAALNVGAATAAEMQLGVGFVDPVEIIVPRRVGLINPLVPAGAFKSMEGKVASVIASGMEPTDHTIILSLDSLRRLLDYTEQEAEAVAIRLQADGEPEQVAATLRSVLGEGYQVLDLAGQHPEVSQLVSMEKWMSYFILLFILVLAAFNIVSSLSMLLIEKKEDIATLHSLGASRQVIARIFRMEGMLVSLIGAVVGIVIGIALCLAQQTYGLVTLQIGLSSVPYPIRIDALDLALIFLTIFALSYAAAYYPVHYFINRRLKQN
ncbi:ABC transporter permease [Porphyromonas loveana]|uniref:Lipoprotein-releasing system permease protein n=2 Tax=Porphyromonas loveana TaxID=1884669 RepID=A0A2U1FAC5_9PORP|nr:FtsX-like permease family protein [Porphyromonas loveana]PVZ09147.1 lipoprotein-releasing system permease protein [Porphyromonas loveana]